MTTCAVPCKIKIKKNGQNIRNPQYWCCIFALWLIITARLLAAAQHSSSELGSALALHINFIVIRRTMLTSGKRVLYFGKEAPFLRESKKRPLRVATKTQRWNISRRPRRWRSKESWLQFMNKPIPLSQQADSSPNKSGEQPRGQFSKLLPV